MYYCIFSFICYGVSNDPQQVKDAEELEEQEASQEDKERAMDSADRERMEHIVAKWMSEKELIIF